MFDPLGKIRSAELNYFGTWHDAALGDKIGTSFINHAPDYCACVDQGFCRSGHMEGIFVGPISKRQRRALHPITKELVLKRHNTYVSLRQSSEWGMRALQGTFPRLKARLCSDFKDRGDLIESIIFLHNFRTELVGLNQIKTVFDPHYEQYINVDGYDRIKSYYADLDGMDEE